MIDTTFFIQIAVMEIGFLLLLLALIIWIIKKISKKIKHNQFLKEEQIRLLKEQNEILKRDRD